MTPFIVDCGTYPFDVLVHFGEDMVPMFDAIERKDGKRASDKLRKYKFGSGFAGMNDSGTMVLWLKEPPTCPRTISLLAHECMHIVRLLFDRVAIPINLSTEEVQAYQLQYLVEKILIMRQSSS